MNCNTKTFNEFYSIQLMSISYKKTNECTMHFIVKNKMTGKEDIYHWESNWGFNAWGPDENLFEHVANYGFTLEEAMEQPLVWEK